MQLTLASVLAFAAAALAVEITSPAKNADWDLSKDNKISWSSVSTDPTTVNILLVNMHVNPPVTVAIANNVPLSKGSYDLKAIKNPPTAGGDYQVNLENSNQAGAILAQSEQFNVEKSSSSPSSGTSSVSSSASSGAPSSTLETIGASTKSSASASASSNSASASSASASASASSSSASASASSSASESSSSSTASGSSSASAASSTPTGGAALFAPRELTGLGALLMGAMMVFA